MSAYTDQASASPTPAWFDRLQSTIRWLVYPVLLGGAMALLWALLALGASLAWAPYLAVASLRIERIGKHWLLAGLVNLAYRLIELGT